MTIKSFERPIIELSHDVVFKHAKIIDKEYKLDIAELSAAEKLEFVSHFLTINTKIDSLIQEYVNHACTDRMYAESQPYGDWEWIEPAWMILYPHMKDWLTHLN